GLCGWCVSMRLRAVVLLRCSRSLRLGLRLVGVCVNWLRRGVGLSTVSRRASSRPCRSRWTVRRGLCLGGLERLRRMCLGLSLILGMLRRRSSLCLCRILFSTPQHHHNRCTFRSCLTNRLG